MLGETNGLQYGVDTDQGQVPMPHDYKPHRQNRILLHSLLE